MILDYNYTLISIDIYSVAALLAMQNAVLVTAIPSICPSVCLSHADTLSRRIKIGSRGHHYEVGKHSVF